MRKVFISYSHDDRETANAVADLLDTIGVEHFFDNRSIKFGQKITSSVHAALEECLAILVILSPSSMGSAWVPYEVGRAEALQKRVLPFLTDASLEVPLYMKDLKRATSLDDIRTYFTCEFSMDGPEARRLEYEQLLFRDQFHNEDAARKLVGNWHARWTREQNGIEEVFEEGTLDVWTTESRLRALGTDSKPGTPIELPFYPMEGVVSADGWIALSYWAAGESRFCGTVLLRRRGGSGRVYEGHWRGFESDSYDEDPAYMSGRAAMARTSTDLQEYCEKNWRRVVPRNTFQKE